MSDDGFTDDWEDGDEPEVEMLDVETDALPHFGLAAFDAPADEAGKISFSSSQIRHGDFYLNPSAYGTFNGQNGLMDNDAMHKWLAKEVVEQPEQLDEAPDIQGWTYIADYSLHPLTPNHERPLFYYLHARIRHDNRIEFGMFESVEEAPSAWKSAVGKVNQILGQQGLEDAHFSASQVLHGDLRPPLRIAGKEEAEAMLLNNGKLVMAACPRSVGVLMNAGQATIGLRYGSNTTYRLVTYYGHIWTYWAAIIDNVLYLVGIPLYTGNDRGSFTYSVGESSGRVRLSLPPTLHDLRSSFAGNTNSPSQSEFYKAAELLWGIEPNAGLASVNHRIGPFLEKYGDYSSDVVLSRRAIARVCKDGLGRVTLEQVAHGDIDSSLTLLSVEGGVYADSGALKVCEGEQVCNGYVDHGAQYSWGQSSGASGFVGTTTRCTVEGRVRYAAQAFYVANHGPSYSIRIISPFHAYGYIPEPGEEGYKILPGVTAIINVPKKPDDDPEDDDPPGGGGGGGGGGGTTPGTGGSSAEDIGDCGIWLENSEGVSVSRKRDDRNGKVGYEYKLTINKTFKVTERLFYSVKANFSVNDGNSYGVGDDQQVTMWYFLQGEIATIRVCNLTSYSSTGQGWTPNSHPQSRTEYEQTGLRSASATGSLPVRYMTSRSRVSSCNQSNIVKLVPTGRIRKVNASLAYIGADGRKHRKRVTGTMKCYRLRLQESTIKQILKNTLRQKTAGVSCTITPASISGSTSGTAGAPTVTSHGVTSTSIPLPIQGESAVRGNYPMKISGKLGGMKVTYNVTSGMTGWYEETPDNRHSASIGGSFVVTAPASQF